ncbi:hypothetical protein MKO06_15550 [Gramella sp. GC03-9]|uniref:Uncharacterized protein n=1 Tax=Christiangramia oceanisediminis TaxID=2920386 RepID=A0A9X2RBY2_9FLAO|nr:hypothetical protein [Gramella oceanisediminis]MCP9201324.1 hypothetical protein [Gramella oceanisediminis]
MSLDTYMAGRNFENLLRKVYPSKSVQANKSLLENALTMEQGHNFARHLGSAEKQFTGAQNKLIKTLAKLCTTKPYNSASKYFEELVDRTERCNSAVSLHEIVENALKKASSLDNSGSW